MVRPTDVVSCFRTRRRLGAYLDGALGARDHRAAAAHLQACARCRGEVDELRRLKRRLHQALAVDPPADWSGFWEGVVRGIEDGRLRPAPAARRPVPALGFVRRHRMAVGGAVAAALVLSATAWQLTPPPAPQAAVMIRSAHTELPATSLMVYSPPERDMAVVWLLDEE